MKSDGKEKFQGKKEPEKKREESKKEELKVNKAQLASKESL